MSDALPDPLTPRSCDLRNFRFMPVDVQRLLKSDSWRGATDSQKAAMTSLWYSSWHEVPAGSLPNDEAILADLANVKAPWSKVRDRAMRGFVLCSDGRLYHPVVAEKALEAWVEKLIARATGGSGNAKRWGGEFDSAALLAKLQDAIRRLLAIAPNSETLKKKAVVQAMAGIAPGSAPDRKPPSPPESAAQAAGDPAPESDRDRNRQGQGQGLDLENPAGSHLSGGAAPPPALVKPNPAPKSATKKPAAKPKAPKPPPPTTGQSPTVPTWTAYAEAYRLRYGIDPLRNAKVSAMLAQFVNRVPIDEAPAIATFYVGHDNTLYVRSGHAVNLLLRDAESLRTQWATGRKLVDRVAPAQSLAEKRTATLDALTRRTRNPSERIESGSETGRTIDAESRFLD